MHSNVDSMDGTGEHDAKWNKPGGERQIPYDLTYEWTLINTTNKHLLFVDLFMVVIQAGVDIGYCGFKGEL